MLGKTRRDLEERYELARADVALCMSTGMTNKEIACAFGRAESTIELHVTRIMRKSGASNRATLISMYYRL